QGKELLLEGRHNADIGWISELRKRGDAEVLPRAVIEVHLNDLLRKKQREKSHYYRVQRNGLSWSAILHDASMRKTVLVLCKLEFTQEANEILCLFTIVHNSLSLRFNFTIVLQFVRQIGETLHTVSLNEKDKQFLELIYVIGPPNPEKLQNHDFGAVDGFSVMTFDFLNSYNSGPNAPLKWIHSILQLLLRNANKSEPSP
ncbi:hypothetical protein V2J09_014113, partial [Rumex salicifolius]